MTKAPKKPQSKSSKTPKALTAKSKISLRDLPKKLEKPRHIYLLLACVLFLPLIAETLQKILIGDERALADSSFFQFRAPIAHFLRPISNLLIGGSIVVGTALAVYGAVIAVRKIAPQFSPRPKRKTQPASRSNPRLARLERRLFLVTVVIFTTYIVCLFLAMLTFFVLRNEAYWYGRPWSGGGLYDGAWYSLSHWQRIIFH